MQRRTEVIVLQESVAKSVISDAVSFVTVIGVIGAGWLMESSAMQWLGFLSVITIIVVRAGGVKHRMTIQEAQEHLARLAESQCADDDEAGERRT